MPRIDAIITAAKIQAQACLIPKIRNSCQNWPNGNGAMVRRENDVKEASHWSRLRGFTFSFIEIGITDLVALSYIAVLSLRFVTRHHSAHQIFFVPHARQNHAADVADDKDNNPIGEN